MIVSPELIIYYIVFFLLSIIAFVSISSEGKKYEPVLIFAVVVFLSLFASLKVNYPDQEGYRTFFYEAASLGDVLSGNNNYSELYGVERGFLFLNSLIKFFSENDVVFFIIIAFVTVGIIVYCCKKISPYPLLSVLCYYSWFYYTALGSIRHALASSLILLMVVNLANNKRMASSLLYLSAFSIHRSSFPGFLLVIMSYMAKRRMLVCSIIPVLIVINYYGGIGKDIVSLTLPYVGQAAKLKLVHYLNPDGYNSVSESLSRGVVFKQFFISILCLYYYKILDEKYKAFSLVFFCYFIGFSFLVIFQDFKIISNRVSHLFSISEIILLPMLFSLIVGREKIISFLFLNASLFYQFNLLIGVQYYFYKFIL